MSSATSVASGDPVAFGSIVNNLFKLDRDTVEVESACAANDISDSTVLWHRRLGHVSLSNMKFITNHIKFDLKLKMAWNA